MKPSNPRRRSDDSDGDEAFLQATSLRGLPDLSTQRCRSVGRPVRRNPRQVREKVTNGETLLLELLLGKEALKTRTKPARIRTKALS